MHALIREVFGGSFAPRARGSSDDSAVIRVESGRLAFSTDSFMVKPIFFPGGDLGKLAVCGTANDLAMVGAKPRWLSVSFLLEEGLEIEVLEKICRSIAKTANDAGVEVVTGDTKVAEKGAVDEIYITTSGVGIIEEGIELSGSRAKPGMAVLVSGTVGDHEIAILNARENLTKATDLKSDCAPLGGLVQGVLAACPGAAACFRDPTRGGLAATLNEIATQSGTSVEIEEASVPIKKEVAGLCELLGLDPFFLACEGKLVAFVKKEKAHDALAAMRSAELGKNAAIIGTVKDSPAGMVVLRTKVGGTRVLDMPSGRLLPRVC